MCTIIHVTYSNNPSRDFYDCLIRARSHPWGVGSYKVFLWNRTRFQLPVRSLPSWKTAFEDTDTACTWQQA